MSPSEVASTIQLIGAGAFGAIIGWYVYFINRYRKADVQLSDLVTVIGIVGGGAVLALFPPKTDLFGAYGIGLAIGFFGYFFALIFMVGASENFNVDWFLDGRARLPKPGEWGYPTPGERPMSINPGSPTAAPTPPPPRTLQTLPPPPGAPQPPINP